MSTWRLLHKQANTTAQCLHLINIKFRFKKNKVCMTSRLHVLLASAPPVPPPLLLVVRHLVVLVVRRVLVLFREHVVVEVTLSQEPVGKEVRLTRLEAAEGFPIGDPCHTWARRHAGGRAATSAGATAAPGMHRFSFAACTH